MLFGATKKGVSKRTVCLCNKCPCCENMPFCLGQWSAYHDNLDVSPKWYVWPMAQPSLTRASSPTACRLQVDMGVHQRPPRNPGTYTPPCSAKHCFCRKLIGFAFKEVAPPNTIRSKGAKPHRSNPQGTKHIKQRPEPTLPRMLKRGGETEGERVT